MIPEIAPYNNYIGDGATTQFDFDFYIENASQLIVQYTAPDGTPTILTKDTDYSIHEIGNKNGSYITFPLNTSSYSVLSANETISLILTLPIAQESEYGTSSELELSSIEYSFDYLTRLVQILSRKLERATKVQEGSRQSVDEFIETLQRGTHLAEKWAEYMDGAVDGDKYSSKYNAVISSNYATIAQQQADRAQQYASSTEIGMRWVGFTSDDWAESSGKYTLTLEDVAIVNAIYKGAFSDKKLIKNCDINVTASGCVITSLDAFSGYALTNSNVLED